MSSGRTDRRPREVLGDLSPGRSTAHPAGRRTAAPPPGVQRQRPTAAGLGSVTATTDGSGARELDFGMAGDWASWRPDGRQIAFRGQPGDGARPAFIADADGTNVRSIWPSPPRYVDPSMASAGRRTGRALSFIERADRSGHRLADRHRGHRRDGIGDGPSPDEVRRRDSLDEMHPDWSPDSTYIAFQMEKDGGQTRSPSRGPMEPVSAWSAQDGRPERPRLHLVTRWAHGS